MWPHAYIRILDPPIQVNIDSDLMCLTWIHMPTQKITNIKNDCQIPAFNLQLKIKEGGLP